MIEDAKVIAHWSRGGLLDVMLAALADAGVDCDNATAADLAPLDHLHARGADATRELLTRLDPAPGSRLLDIGGGVGGPARMAASEFGCRVAAIDLTDTFCAVARAFNEITGLTERIDVHQASALDLPFADATFDGAYTQNVSMNIAHKARFYAEAARVLKPGAAFAAAECATGPGGDPVFPVPWADTAETSHILPEAETRRVLEAAGFEVLEFIDNTDVLMAHYEESRRRLEDEGPPVLGPHVVIGPSAREKMRNAARCIEERRVLAIEILCRRKRES